MINSCPWILNSWNKLSTVQTKITQDVMFVLYTILCAKEYALVCKNHESIYSAFFGLLDCLKSIIQLWPS